MSMLKKLINRSEGSQVEIIDSTLRDIIPSNDVTITKKPRQKRFSSICKILISMFLLGLIAIGIVLLALILAFSGKTFMNYIIHSSGESLSSNTSVLPVHEANVTAISNEQDWKKITVLPTMRTKQGQTNRRSDEPLTSTAIQTTGKNKITIADILTSTNENKKKLLFAKYKKLEDDQLIDDLFNF